MSIINIMTPYDFRRPFECARPDNFTYQGLNALYEYFEQLSENNGEHIEYDMIAICCEYSEYSDFEDLQNDYNAIESMEDLERNTVVIRVGTSGFIIQQF